MTAPRNAITALLAMASAADRSEARDWLNEAILRGLTIDEADEAMRLWDAERNGEVRTVDDAPRCQCRHARTYHNPNTRLCYGSAVCACAAYRPNGETK